jgi:hypothetical protein
MSAYLLKRLLSSIRSFCAGAMAPLELLFACFSKFRGNLSRGRMNVLTEHFSCSGGVGSSICTKTYEAKENETNFEGTHCFAKSLL